MRESHIDLKHKLIDKNDPSSLIEVILTEIEEQNKSLVDKNNEESILSVLLKSNRATSIVTWVITTVTMAVTLWKLIFG